MLAVTTQTPRLKMKTDPKTRETDESDIEQPLLLATQPLPPSHHSLASYNSMQPPIHHQQQIVDSASASAQQPTQQAPAASSPTRS